MTKASKLNDDFSKMTQYLQSLLAIELWRGGLSQVQIGKRLGIATGTVNKILKGISRDISIKELK